MRLYSLELRHTEPFLEECCKQIWLSSTNVAWRLTSCEFGCSIVGAIGQCQRLRILDLDGRVSQFTDKRLSSKLHPIPSPLEVFRTTLPVVFTTSSQSNSGILKLIDIQLCCVNTREALKLVAPWSRTHTQTLHRRTLLPLRNTQIIFWVLSIPTATLCLDFEIH